MQDYAMSIVFRSQLCLTYIHLKERPLLFFHFTQMRYEHFSLNSQTILLYLVVSIFMKITLYREIMYKNM